MTPAQAQELLAPVVASWEARQAQQTIDQYLQFRRALRSLGAPLSLLRVVLVLWQARQHGLLPWVTVARRWDGTGPGPPTRVHPCSQGWRTSLSSPQHAP